jgi:hypothetical protein
MKTKHKMKDEIVEKKLPATVTSKKNLYSEMLSASI